MPQVYYILETMNYPASDIYQFIGFIHANCPLVYFVCFIFYQHNLLASCWHSAVAQSALY